MKKIIVLLSLVLFLTGCQTDQNKFKKSINTAVENALKAEVVAPTLNNNTKTYYSFYQTKNAGKLSSDEISNSFVISGNDCALSLDVSSILEGQIYEENKNYVLRNAIEIKDSIYSKKGTFVNSSDEIIPYVISVSKNTEKEYFILIQTSQFVFVSSVSQGDCSDTIFEMLVLLRSCEVDSTQVILDYSSDSVIASQSVIITLFEEILPESGTIIDYIEDWRDDSSFIIIKENEEE